jgi:WYL domain
MAHLTPDQFDRLERAVDEGRRISVVRRGHELVVVPIRLFVRGGREIVEARHPTTGDILSFRLDDVDSVEVVS